MRVDWTDIQARLLELSNETSAELQRLWRQKAPRDGRWYELVTQTSGVDFCILAALGIASAIMTRNER